MKSKERLIWICILGMLVLALLLLWIRDPIRAPLQGQKAVDGSESDALMTRQADLPVMVDRAAYEGDVDRSPDLNRDADAVDSDTVRKTIWLVNTELDSYRDQIKPLEAKAGDSADAYREFLKMQLRIITREDALKSVQAGRLRYVPDSTANPADLFEGGSYVMFSTGPSRGGVRGMVAVPLIREADIAAMREAIAQTTDTVISDFVLKFNSQSEERRVELREQFEQTGTMDGMPETVRQNQTRLKWSENGCLLRDQG